MPRREPTLGLALLVALALPAACATAPARDPALVAYLESADHLDDAQRRALLEGRPFEGMTPEEADLALRFESADVLWYGDETESAVAFYQGRDGRYALRFAGSPPRVVDWILYPEPELPPLDDYRPDFPR